MIWDKAYGAISAVVKRLDDGKFEGSLAFSHVDISLNAETLAELLKSSEREASARIKSIMSVIG